MPELHAHLSGLDGMLRRCAARFAMLVGAALGTAWTVAAGQQPAAPPSTAAPLVFDGVTVIDVERGSRLPAQRVVIVGNHIQAMGSAVPVPAGAQVVDARGKYLIPGLWDMHTHSLNYTSLFYPLFLVNGVTGIRDASSVMPLDTLRLWRREILVGTRIGPPRQVLSGPALFGPDPGCEKNRTAHRSPWFACVADSADAQHVVDSLKADGADIIKTYDLQRQIYFVIAAEARRVGMPFGGHLSSETATAIEASDSGALIVDHLDSDLNGRCWEVGAPKRDSGSSVARCQPVAERFRRNGTWAVPTALVMMLFVSSSEKNWSYRDARFVRGLINISRAFWTPAALPGDWLRDSVGIQRTIHTPPNTSTHSDSAIDSFVMRLADAPRAVSKRGVLRTAHRVGLPIIAGTDVFPNALFGGMLCPLCWMLPGFSLHTELAILVAEGLTPLEALQAATLNPAKALRGTDSLGTVAPGKLADLVLLDADPLVDITNTTAIRAVVANGRYFDRAALDQVIATVRATARATINPRKP